MVAAQVNNVQRYIMLSSINNDVNSQSPIAHYHRAKAHADNYLLETELDYTIVCPGRLTDDSESGRVSITENLVGKGIIKLSMADSSVIGTPPPPPPPAAMWRNTINFGANDVQ